ncbi:MAG TPA: hypothetical protein VKB68_15220 [Stellaceae bacterium]|nr:hypothetical protein [Stellaceae bacterium]
MDIGNITTVVGYIAGVSVANERLTEVIKGIPVLSPLLVGKPGATGEKEESRKAVIHVVAIAIGTCVTWLSYDQVKGAAGIDPGLGVYFLFGAMSAGGSGMWNSVLDILRQVNQQKQKETEKP